MAKTQADKQTYTAKKKAQDKENYLQEEWFRKKNRLLSTKNKNGSKYEEYLKKETERKRRERQKKKKIYEYLAIVSSVIVKNLSKKL